MPHPRRAKLLDSFQTTSTVVWAFTRRRANGSRAVFRAIILMQVNFLATLAQISGGQQWFDGSGAVVSITAPRWSRSWALSSAAVLAQMTLGLAAVGALYFLSTSLFVCAYLTALAWLIASAIVASKNQSAPATTRAELKRMKRTLGPGWTVSGLASTGRAPGAAFELTRAAITSFPSGRMIYTAAVDEVTAFHYQRRGFIPWGKSGLVFYYRT